MRAAPAVLLLVLGDVEKMREVAERAHEVQRLFGIDGIQLALELAAAGAFVRFVFLAEAHRRLPDALDALESRIARLAADHFAQQPPEEAAVLAQQ